jgi:hypothetical protein
VDKDLRASLVAAGSAAALSALVGLFAGVAFLALLLRAAVCAVLVGAAAYGCALLLRNLVPGLLTADEAPAEGVADFDALRGEESAKGANVDIVLPGEDASAEAFSEEEPRGFPSARQALRPASAKAGRAAGRAGAEEDAAERAPVEEASLLDPESGDGEAGAGIPAAASPEKGRRSDSGFEDLDVLPDLEGFSDSFTSSEFSSGGSPAVASQKGYGGQGSSGSKPGHEGLDPASLAQAVRTILKRDQKG